MGIPRVKLNSATIGMEPGHTSKGNQRKWQQGAYWYKADAWGYESLAETMVSALLKKSNIKGFVSYQPVWLDDRGKSLRGCRSKNFRGEMEELRTLESLAYQISGMGLAKELGRIGDVKERIRYTVELVEGVTGLPDFGKYLTQMLEIDAFFLNEDRHTNNISVIYDVVAKEYRLCPFYDCGLALFSDTREAYPLTDDVEACLGRIEAKPFSRDFDEALDAANELYGSFLHFRLSRQEMNRLVVEELEKWAPLYTAEELARVEETLRGQVRKYQYLFA